MPLKAFVLAQTEPQKTREVLGKLPKPTYSTMGRWDTVISLQAETPKMLAEQVLNEIRKQDGIRRTETLPVLTSVLKPGPSSCAVKALVFFNTSAPKTNEVFGNLAGLSETLEVHTVAGRYDIIATFGFNTWDEYTERIVNQVRKIEGITATETALIVS